MFFGRKKELKELQAKIDSQSCELGIVYGIRQVGKTTLLKQIIKKNKGIYFLADKTGIEKNLEKLSEQIVAYFKESFISPFRDYYSLFSFILKKQNKKKKTFLLVIDEFSYLIKSDNAILSIFQKIKDEYLNGTNIKIILSGSHLGLMRDIDTFKEPLYSRTTFKLKIMPFDYVESALFYPNLRPVDKILFYSIFGGMPLFLSQIKKNQSLLYNLKNIFLTDPTKIERDFSFFLGEENRKSQNYEPLLKLLSSKKNFQLKDLSSSLKIPSSNLVFLLQNLEEMEIVEKEMNYNEKNKNSKKTNYSLKENYLKFYYHFIKPNLNHLVLMNHKKFYEIFIEPQLEQFISFGFEKICRLFLIKKYQKKGTIINIGRFWENNASRGVNLEIDIILSEIKQNLTLFECKWTKQRVDFEVIKQLQNKLRQIENYDFVQNQKINLGFFSKNGFDQNISKNKKYLLFTPQDLYKI
ncbi:ATP-binding protein [Candidatus Phytoplasma sp. AldY-WA1]|uniref:ATP-binding protein n=1 Tax=Candidatus Phytoplasma sp. AldY-WA1 TaxID=2852100 RepID=UPI00254E1817|nr:ATP-binding protein [Candidatus Phytoplasma sp. AldY-WA1]